MDDFDEFFAEHYQRVVGSLELAGGSPRDAEDAAQEAFVKALSRWRSVSTMDRPATWVYVVAVRSMRRKLARPGSAQLDFSGEQPGMADLTESPDLTESIVTSAVVSEALGALPPRQRLAVVLRFHGDLSVPEIARAMRCSQGTVKSTLHTALRHLRVDLTGTNLEEVSDER